jgi:GNAT superfamily N-acetyltransferase
VFGPHDPRLYAALEGGRVVGASVQTPPFGAALSTFDDESAVDAIAERMHADGVDLPSVLAEVAPGRRFVERWNLLSGTTATVAIEQRIYEATEVIPPPPVGGRMRPWKQSDRDLVVEWIDAFMAEAMPGSPEGDGAGFVARKQSDASGALFLWEDEEPVSLAGYGAPSPNGLRVGPVYTPPELRGRGYASALTAAVTETVLSSGRRFAFLYTDLANPTSNSIYQRIGYRPVLDVSRWDFEPA